MDKIYDVAIIGMGPAGQSAVDMAVKQGLEVIAFEKNLIGGTCLNIGCIPTKTILHNIKEKTFSECLIEKDNVVTKLRNALKKTMETLGVQVIEGEAEIDLENKIVYANDIQYKAKNIIIATGSKPLQLKGLEFDHENILSSDDMFNLEKLPKSIAIIGSGAIGIEWARILNMAHVEVYVIEMAQNLLPAMDIDVSKAIEREFKINKIKFFKEVCAKKFENGRLKLSDNQEIEVEKVLVGIGREKVLPKLSNNQKIEIYEDFSTNFQDIYAIGDITKYPMLAHSASWGARAVIKRITKGFQGDFKKPVIPSVIYGSPEIACAGVKEQDINSEEGYKIYNLRLTRLAKAWCDGKTNGFFKIIVKNDLIKGAHIVSDEASSILSGLLVAMNSEIPISTIKNTIFPHPTLAEGIFEALNE